MNVNTIDPFLYRDRAGEAGNNLLRNSKTEKDSPVPRTGFLNQIHEEINSAIDPETRSQISSSNLSFNLDREKVLADISNSPDKSKLYNASKEFESFFVEKMFIEMKKNIPKNPMFHGGYAEDVFDDMLLSERVRKVSDQSEFGLAEMIYQQLSVVYS